MAQQTINIGTTANDGTGDPLRTAFDKVNSNFTELYNDESQGEVNSIIAGDGISVDTATGNVTVTNTITNNNQLTNGAGYVDGSGTANKLPKFTDSDTIGNSIVTDNGTGIGINNSNPTEILEVYKAADNSRFKIQNNAFASWVGNDATGFTIETNLFKPITFKPSGVTAMTLDSSGNVGINTSSPTYPLTINTGAGTFSVRAKGGSSVSIASSASLTYFGDTHEFSNSAGTSEAMRIDSSGNVGIGTSSPAVIGAGNTSLTVAGSAGGGTQVKGSSVTGEIYASDAAGGVFISSKTNHPVVFRTNDAEKMRIDSSGKILINTTNSASSAFFKVRQDAGFNIGTFSDGTAVGFVTTDDNATTNVPLVFQATDIRLKAGIGAGAGLERMRIDSSGKVGIGVVPYAKLSIVDTNQVLGSEGILSLKASAAAQNNGAQITFGTSSARHAAIAGRQEAAGGSAGYLQFGTRASTGDITERMRIDSLGNAMFNTTNINPSQNNVTGTSILQYGGASMSRSNSTTLDLNRDGSDGAMISLRKSGTQVGKIDVSASGASIYLGGSAAANALDDYEEGTFTPVVADATSGGNTATGTFTGNYTKIGRLVTVNVYLNNIDTTGMTSSNDIYIRNLPFTAIENSYGTAVTDKISYTSGFTNVIFRVVATVNWGVFPQIGSSQVAPSLEVSQVDSSLSDIYFTLTYIA